MAIDHGRRVSNSIEKAIVPPDCLESFKSGYLFCKNLLSREGYSLGGNRA